ncbi:MAG TPA: orotidine-5'-phosphate decarboxylase [Deltaproteobacteria bacterium]|nr:MAG: orotidine-5'-phosphate decarboxylase [Deltaproteobacteria bacterium]HDM78977.1 orotidine-5'-phosphate decarboxylase [Deltaproteobacteria bacterium]
MGKDIPLEKRIILALDVPTVEEAKQTVKQFENRIRFYKIGLQLFLAGWFNIVDWILARDLEVFLDLKFFDVPQTVKLAVEQIRDKGISFTSVHGNDEIMKAAVSAKGTLKILAVTVLTSLDEGDLRDLGFECFVEDLVLSRAKRALEIGCDGVISSGLEAARLREHLGKKFLVVTPGIRPVRNITDDQKRIVTVREAFLNGADYVVIGRPIRNARDPDSLIDRMHRDIREALQMRGF